MGELIINLTLLSLLLQKSDGLQWSLGLHHECSDLIQVIVTNLGFLIFANVLVDSTEKFLDLTLLVDVHF